MNSNFSYKIGKTTDADVQQMKLVKSCMDIKKVLVRGYDIYEQMKIDQNKETNHDGEITLLFSQETMDTFNKDTSFLKKL